MGPNLGPYSPPVWCCVRVALLLFKGHPNKKLTAVKQNLEMATHGPKHFWGFLPSSWKLHIPLKSSFQPSFAAVGGSFTAVGAMNSRVGMQGCNAVHNHLNHTVQQILHNIMLQVSDLRPRGSRYLNIKDLGSKSHNRYGLQNNVPGPSGRCLKFYGV